MSHKAIAITSKGVLEEITVPTPKPGPKDVMIKNQYAAMIAFDTYQLDRAYNVPSYPLVLGFSAAGTVHAVGSDVSDLKAGDRVRQDPVRTVHQNVKR